MNFRDYASLFLSFVKKLNEWFKINLFRYNIIKMIKIEETEWNKFYGEYRELDQFHLQKRLVHFENEYANMYHDRLSPYKRMTYVRKIIREQNGLMPMWRKNSENWQIYTEPFVYYMKTIKPQLDEVIQYYKCKKDESEKRGKERRNARAIEKVMCEICNKMVSRTNLSTHRKSKKCQKCV